MKNGSRVIPLTGITREPFFIRHLSAHSANQPVQRQKLSQQL